MEKGVEAMTKGLRTEKVPGWYPPGEPVAGYTLLALGGGGDEGPAVAVAVAAAVVVAAAAHDCAFDGDGGGVEADDGLLVAVAAVV